MWDINAILRNQPRFLFCLRSTVVFSSPVARASPSTQFRVQLQKHGGRAQLAAALVQAENDCVHHCRPFMVFFAAILAISSAAIALTAPGFAQSNPPQAAPKTKPAPPPEARVDINHASIDQLLKVPGMTPSWAGRIIRFRPYRTKADLLEHGVLPSDVYDRIKDYVIAHRDER